MANQHKANSLRAEVCEYNNQLDVALRDKVGISLKTYKIIKNMTQLVGAAAGVYAMFLGADPLTAFALIAMIIVGPEGIEYVLTNEP